MPDDFKKLVEGWAQEMRDNLEYNDVHRDEVDEDAFERSLNVGPSPVDNAEAESESVREPESQPEKKPTPPRMPSRS